jgi:hypothetical protein
MAGAPAGLATGCLPEAAGARISKVWIPTNGRV